MWTLRGLVSEFHKAVDEWDVVMPVANYVISHRRRQVFGGCSAIEVMTDRHPDSAVKMTVWSGTHMKDTVRGEEADQ